MFNLSLLQFASFAVQLLWCFVCFLFSLHTNTTTDMTSYNQKEQVRVSWPWQKVTNIFNDCLFSNNRVTSSSSSAVSIIWNLLSCLPILCYSNTHFFHCTFTLFSLVVQSLYKMVKLWWTTAYSLTMLQ